MEPQVFLFSPPGQAHNSRVAGRMTDLQGYGFLVQACEELPALQHRVGQACAQDTGPAPAALVLLDASLNQNCAAARLLRMRHPAVGIVSLLDEQDEAALVAVLQCGTDIWCPRGASAGLLAATLFSLLRRGMPPVPEHAPEEVSGENWALRGQAWVLESPSGGQVALTTSERAFVLVLAAQPGLRASHADLLAAIDGCGQADSPDRHTGQARLGVLVSRLRRKFKAQHGIDLPIKSLHKWGYMFAGGLLR